jgi:cellulose synthase/poly-beta-1,6-N-acetylglucosamine synthase-like glycosyltransferase
MPTEVLVIDNNSTDRSVEIARHHPFVRVVTESSQGIAYARNTGFTAAHSEVLARLDADSRPAPNWVAIIIETFEQHPESAALTGAPLFYDVPLSSFFNFWQVALYQYFQRLLNRSPTLWGANMALRQSAWQQVATKVTLRSNIDEDVDLSFCLQEQELPIMFLPHLKVGASLQRGQWGVLHTARYLSTWPRDYWLHRRYIRAFIVAIVATLLMILSLPCLIFLRLTWQRWRSSRRRR